MKQVSPTFSSLEETTKRFIGISSLRIKMWQSDGIFTTCL